MGEQPDLSLVRRVVTSARRRWHMLAAVTAALLLTAGLVTSLLMLGSANAKIDRLSTEIDQISTEIMALELRDAQHDLLLAEERTQIGEVQDTTTFILGLIPSNLVNRLDDAEWQVYLLDDRIGDADSEIDDLKACVNDYMDTIGDWSRNVYSYYNYYYCF